MDSMFRLQKLAKPSTPSLQTVQTVNSRLVKRPIRILCAMLEGGGLAAAELILSQEGLTSTLLEVLQPNIYSEIYSEDVHLVSSINSAPEEL